MLTHDSQIQRDLAVEEILQIVVQSESTCCTWGDGSSSTLTSVGQPGDTSSWRPNFLAEKRVRDVILITPFAWLFEE